MSILSIYLRPCAGDRLQILEYDVDLPKNLILLSEYNTRWKMVIKLYLSNNTLYQSSYFRHIHQRSHLVGI